MTTTTRSNCCGAPLSVGGKGTTHYWICSCCGQPCDELLVIAAELDGNTGDNR